MKFLGRRGSLAAAVVGVACILSTALWAGGAGFGDDDDASEEEGPAYFGFVKDTNGATMPDAKVTVGIKDRGGVVTRTDALGAYKVPASARKSAPMRSPSPAKSRATSRRGYIGAACRRPVRRIRSRPNARSSGSSPAVIPGLRVLTARARNP